MAQTTRYYPQHPPNFANYNYNYTYRYPRTPQSHNAPQYASYNYNNIYYTPQRQYSYSAPQLARYQHARRATDGGYGYGYTFAEGAAYSTLPRQGPGYNMPPEFMKAGHRAPAQETPVRKSKKEDVKPSSRKREEKEKKPRTPQRQPAADTRSKQQSARKSSSDSKKHRSSSRVHVVYDDASSSQASEPLPRYEKEETKPPTYRRTQSFPTTWADARYAQYHSTTAPRRDSRREREPERDQRSRAKPESRRRRKSWSFTYSTSKPQPQTCPTKQISNPSLTSCGNSPASFRFLSLIHISEPTRPY